MADAAPRELIDLGATLAHALDEIRARMLPGEDSIRPAEGNPEAKALPVGPDLGKLTASVLASITSRVEAITSGPAAPPPGGQPAAQQASGGPAGGTQTPVAALLGPMKALAGLIPIVGSSIRVALAGLENALGTARQASQKYQAAAKAAAVADEQHKQALAAVEAATRAHARAVRDAGIFEEAADAAQTKANRTGRPRDRFAADAAVAAAGTARRDVTRQQTDLESAKKSAGETGKTASAAGKAAQDLAPGGLPSVATALGGVALAATAAVGAITGAVAAVRGFVAAFSPGSILVFDQALQNLQATIGVAFTPVFEILAGAFREVSGLILPVMEALRPVVAQVVESFTANLLPQVKVLATLFEALVPLLAVFATLYEALQAAIRPVLAVFQVLAVLIGANLQLLALVLTPVTESLKVFAAIMDGISTTVEVLAVVLKALSDTVMAALRGFLLPLFDSKGLIASINSAFKTLISSMLIFVGTLAKFFGADKFLGALIAGLKPKAGAVAAAQNPAQKSFEQIATDLSLASSIAAGKAGEKEPAKLDDVVSRLEAIRDGSDKGNVKLVEVLTQIRDFLRGLERTKEKASVAFDRTKKAAGSGAGLILSPGGYLLSKLLGG